LTFEILKGYNIINYFKCCGKKKYLLYCEINPIVSAKKYIVDKKKECSEKKC